MESKFVLPNELLFEIIKYLNFQEIISLSCSQLIFYQILYNYINIRKTEILYLTPIKDQEFPIKTFWNSSEFDISKYQKIYYISEINNQENYICISEEFFLRLDKDVIMDYPYIPNNHNVGLYELISSKNYLGLIGVNINNSINFSVLRFGTVFDFDTQTPMSICSLGINNIKHYDKIVQNNNYRVKFYYDKRDIMKLKHIEFFPIWSKHPSRESIIYWLKKCNTLTISTI